LITGVTQGSLGAEVALQLSRHRPGLIILAGRNLSKIQATENVIKSASPGISTRLLKLDLSSQKQVRKAAEEVNHYAEPVDRLINNAAIMAAPYSATEDGLESQFGTNHIGHFLFTNLIMPKILTAGKGARIVNVSSAGHKREQMRFDDYNFEVRVILRLVISANLTRTSR
jgi:NAD(P)-dependent dehydrogenase (short-subunit alcohol dehydrogenase family)